MRASAERAQGQRRAAPRLLHPPTPPMRVCVVCVPPFPPLSLFPLLVWQPRGARDHHLEAEAAAGRRPEACGLADAEGDAAAVLHPRAHRRARPADGGAAPAQLVAHPWGRSIRSRGDGRRLGRRHGGGHPPPRRRRREGRWRRRQQQRWQRRQQRWQRRRGRRRRQQSSGRRWRQCAIHHRAAACGWDRGGTLEAGIGGAPGGGGPGGGGGIGGGRWERGPDDDAPPPGRGRPGCQRTRRRHQRRGRWWPRWGRAVGAARATAADGGGGYHLLPAGNGRRQSGAERGACGGRQPSGRSIQCASHQCRLPRRARHHVAVHGGCDRTGRPRCQRLRDRSRPALGGAD